MISSKSDLLEKNNEKKAWAGGKGGEGNGHSLLILHWSESHINLKEDAPAKEDL